MFNDNTETIRMDVEVLQKFFGVIEAHRDRRGEEIEKHVLSALIIQSTDSGAVAGKHVQKVELEIRLPAQFSEQPVRVLAKEAEHRLPALLRAWADALERRMQEN